MAEWIDKDGSLLGWFSDDPDDWNTWSDYEMNIRKMVLEYNEEAFVIGEHLLGFDWFKVLDMIKLLARINVSYVQSPVLQEKLKCIRMWANWRVASCRPDDVDEQEIQGADDDIGDCAFELGICYRDGRKVLEPDLKKAYEWIRKASLLGTCNAGNVLGELFENGWGCEKNLRKALYWYDVSQTGVENGDILREKLRLSGDTLPLRLDGFRYDIVHYIHIRTIC